MATLQIQGNVSQEESSAVQRSFDTRGQCTGERETYISPDRKSTLDLEFDSEIPFGPRLFTGNLRSKEGVQSSLWRGMQSPRFLSPGCYGRGYDHWSGDPWSPDSRQIALFRFKGSKAAAVGEGGFLDVDSKRWIPFWESTGILSHHMWSSRSTYYLFRDLKSWYVLTVSSKQIRHLSIVSDYPRHCYFVSDKYVLLLEGNCRVLSAESLELLCERDFSEISAAGTDVYSLYDPGNDRVLFGVKASIRDVVFCEKWYAVKVE